MPSVIRGIPLVPLDGAKSIELESNYELVFLLRRLDEDGVDAGAVSLRPYDTANENDADGSPDGGGYSGGIKATPGDTAYIVDTTDISVLQNGVRATGTLTFTGVADNTKTVTIVYPDMSDPTVAAPITTVVYTWKTLLSPTVTANEIVVTGDASTDCTNLINAINGTYDYGDPAISFGTEACVELIAVRGAGNVVHLEARDGGLWGNNVATTTDLTNASWGAALMTSGTGTRGVTLSINHTALPSSLISTGITRVVNYDIMGLDDSTPADPTKLVGGPASLYATNTVTT